MEGMSQHSSRRSRIFLRRRPLSCEVPSRRDSVGGGVVAEFFRGLRKPTRFSGGGVGSRMFPWSTKADAIQWGGGIVAQFFRGLQ